MHSAILDLACMSTVLSELNPISIILLRQAMVLAEVWM